VIESNTLRSVTSVFLSFGNDKTCKTWEVVNYESTKREVKRRPIHECLCSEIFFVKTVVVYLHLKKKGV
jgi:hypothetical protein